MKVGFFGGLFLFNSNVNHLWVSRFFFLFFFWERGRQTQEKKAEVHVYFLEYIPLKKMICPSLIPQPPGA